MKTLKITHDVPLAQINEDRPTYLELLAEGLSDLADMSKGSFHISPWGSKEGTAALTLACMIGYLEEIAKMNGLRIKKEVN